MHDVDRKRVFSTEFLGEGADTEVREPQAQKHDDIGHDLRTDKRNGGAFLVVIEFIDRGKRAGGEKDQEDRADVPDAEDLLFVLSDQHTHHGIAEADEDRISELIEFTDTHVGQYDIGSDQSRRQIYRVLQDLQLV